MSCYDSVTFYCPDCGQPLTIQSKSGKCCLSHYPARMCPVDVAVGVFNETETCPDCGATWKLTGGPDEIPAVVLAVQRA